MQHCIQQIGMGPCAQFLYQDLLTFQCVPKDDFLLQRDEINKFANLPILVVSSVQKEKL